MEKNMDTKLPLAEESKWKNINMSQQGALAAIKANQGCHKED